MAERAGFENVRVFQEQADLVMKGGVGHAVRAAYSTPIGPRLTLLPEDRQNRFRDVLADIVSSLTDDGVTIGQMASNVLTAEKSATV